MYPHVEVGDVTCAVHLPGDGQCDPANIAMALAKGARMRGAQIVEGVKVTPSPTTASASPASTGSGRRDRPHRRRHRHQLRRHVGPRSGRAIGRDAAAPCLRAFLSRHGTHRGPRPPAGPARPDECAYYKSDAGKMMLGAFEPRAKPWGMSGIPEDFCFDALPEDFEHFEPILDMATRRMPMFETAGIHTFFNGPESFTPDDRYYLGEAPELARLLGRGRLQLHRHRLLRRRGHGAGAMDRGRRAALRPVGGRHPPRAAVPAQPPLPEGTRDRNARPALRRSLALPAGRDRARRAPKPGARAPEAGGAVFGEVAGWERANWFADPGQAREYRYGWHRQNWFENSRAEHMAVREGVGLFDMTSFGKIRVEGRDAAPSSTGSAPTTWTCRPGADRLHPDAQRAGGIESDLTVTRLSETAFLLVVPARRCSATWLAPRPSRRALRHDHRHDGGGGRVLRHGAEGARSSTGMSAPTT
jgi:hypothetical protein